MLNVKQFYDLLVDSQVEYFVGIPDSLLKSFCAYVSDTVESNKHVIAANEGAAVGLAMGYHLATSNIPLVYMQNSGLGNAINPLLSLADDDVYGIPMVLLIGWRGQPNVKDEPQHVKQGRVTEDLLKVMEIPYVILSSDTSLADMKASINEITMRARASSAPVAILVEKNSFDSYKMEKPRAHQTVFELSREDAIASVLACIPDSAAVVSTTGMASREVFEIRESLAQGHAKDFLTVGGMGHASQIAMGLAGQIRDRKIVCIDGDGAFIMHMGSVAVVGVQKPDSLVHIVLNNGAHDSVGGQATVGFDINICEVAKSCGYPYAKTVSSAADIQSELSNILKMTTPALLEIKIQTGSRSDLGRPTTTPKQNKEAFIEHIALG